MRALGLLLFLLLPALEASEAKWTRLLLEQMIGNLTPPEKQKVYVADAHIKQSVEGTKAFEIVSECARADIIIDDGSASEIACGAGKPAIVLSYRAFLERGNAVGAFFWMKGRPTVIYLAPRLESFHLKVTDKLQKYVVKEL